MAFTIRDGDPEVYLLAALYNELESPWVILRDRGVSWDARRAMAAKFTRYRLATENPWRATAWGREMFRRHCLALNGITEVTLPPAGWKAPSEPVPARPADAAEKYVLERQIAWAVEDVATTGPIPLVHGERPSHRSRADRLPARAPSSASSRR